MEEWIEAIGKVITDGGTVPPLSNTGAKPVVSKTLSWVKKNVLSEFKMDEVSFGGLGGR
jgi:hypothetical protein